jgi:hypothetical protein
MSVHTNVAAGRFGPSGAEIESGSASRPGVGVTSVARPLAAAAQLVLDPTVAGIPTVQRRDFSVRRMMVLAAALAATTPVFVGLAPAANSAASGAPSPGGLPIIRDHGMAASGRALPVISINWSGYAATATSKFTHAATKFVQPAITCTGAKHMITSNWVGLDGFTDQTVEQVGTFAFCGGTTNMTPTYVAWFEMYPNGSVNVFSVAPGDTITASVSVKSGSFSLAISDVTSHKSHTHVATCSTCQRASAEWIIERAAFCTNASCSTAVIGAMSDFGKTTMSNDVASDGGANLGIGSFPNYPIQGVYNLNDTPQVGPKGFISVDTVGPVSTSNNSFTATWDRSGKPTPITL